MFTKLGRILMQARTSTVPTAPEPTLSLLHGRRVLVVEDDPSILALVQKKLTALGAHVFTAGDGDSAMQEFYTARPEVVLMDIMLPVLSGFELGRRFRALSQDSGLAMVAMSARDLPQDVAHAQDCGFDDYVTKPFRLNTLEERLHGALQARA